MINTAQFINVASSRIFKLFLLFGIFAFLVFINTNTVVAQEMPSYEEPAVTQETTINTTSSSIPQNSHYGVQILFFDIMSAISCQLAGVDPSQKDGKCLGVDPNTGQVGFVENDGGAIAFVGGLIGATLTPPTSSTQYIAHLKDNFGIAKNTYAQRQPETSSCSNDQRGVGFCGLEPLLPLWTTMRNIVYLLFIVVFMVIGIAIMLRVHVDPRTVMTIQNQIPKIIVGIVAITFSFAIAGFLIDIMWVAMYLFADVIQSAAPAGTLSVQQSINITHSNSPFDAAEVAYPGGIIELTRGTANAFSEVIAEAFSIIDTGLLQDIVRGVVNWIAFLIILFAIIIALLRLLVKLVMVYINVILDVVFGPWWILFGLVPGSPLSLGSWLRDLIANLAVFPVAIGFFLLGSLFVQSFARNVDDIGGALTPPLMGSANPSAVAALIGLGFILMLPNLLDTLKAALKTPNMNLGPIMGPVAAGAGIVTGAPRRVSGGVVNEVTRRRLPGESEVSDPFWKKSVRAMSGRG